jgi:hypothetical protein
MKQVTALRTILIIGIAGLLFSGYLSAKEIFWECSSCSLASADGIFGTPVCVIGFFMYLLVVGVAVLGLFGGKRGDQH